MTYLNCQTYLKNLTYLSYLAYLIEKDCPDYLFRIAEREKIQLSKVSDQFATSSQPFYTFLS